MILDIMNEQRGRACEAVIAPHIYTEHMGDVSGSKARYNSIKRLHLTAMTCIVSQVTRKRYSNSILKLHFQHEGFKNIPYTSHCKQI